VTLGSAGGGETDGGGIEEGPNNFTGFWTNMPGSIDWSGTVIQLHILTTTWNGQIYLPPQHLFTLTGSYTIDGTTARLFCYTKQVIIGTAVLLDINNLSLTLNQNSDAPGTYTLFRLL
jgi:hypothetical protein